MKSIIMVILFLAVGWYGNEYYKQNGMPFKQYISALSNDSTQVKCITKEGHVLYGKRPAGTVCEKIEPVEGAFLVVPSAIRSHSDKSVDKASQQASQYHCDGRSHCSQMRSCEEAYFFLQHCPNTKMDGNNDGVPCERQWCY